MLGHPWRQVAFSDLGTALQTLTRYMLNLDPPPYDLTLDAASTLFLLIFIAASVVGVMNILIAQVGWLRTRIGAM